MESFSDVVKHRMKAEGSENRSPLFFRTDSVEGKEEFVSFLESHQDCVLSDIIESQLRDLIKLENPERPLSDEEYNQKIKARLGGRTPQEYGVWVYYPWKNTMVHLLDEEEFIRVRTIRNAYKITFEEQAILRTKKVGVIGLSVGQSVSVAIAMERIAGEIRIADFDTLELSNMNRIRTGVHNLGLMKTTMVAREIAELDPYIKVICFDDGVTQENAHLFFEGGGKLDLLVEECDGLDIKIFAREEARKRQIPVVMEMSDRCMLDIERYDLHPDYPILHGLIGKDIDFTFLSSLKTTDEKMPYMMPISGSDTLSPKMKASILELTSTLTTWPQLASDVSLGGAISAIVARKILLGDKIESKRQWLDIEKNLGFGQKNVESTIEADNKSIDNALLKKELDSLQLERKPKIDKAHLNKIIEAAILAPSPGNNQTWRFVEYNGYITICDPRETVEHSFGDNLNINSHIAFGTALENILQVMHSFGMEPLVELIDSKTASHIKAIVSVKQSGSISPKPNYASEIFTRQTLRQQPNIDSLTEQQIRLLTTNQENTCSKVVTNRDAILKIGELISKGDRIRLLNKQGHLEFFDKEVRLSREEARKHKTGLDVTLFPFSESDKAGLRLMADINSRNLLDEWKLGRGLEKLSKKSFINAPAVVTFFTKSLSPSDIIRSGMEIEATWLKAVKEGIYFQPMTVLQCLFSFLHDNTGNILSTQELDEVRSMKMEFDNIFPENKKEYSLFLAIAGRTTKEEEKSYRKDLAESFVQL